MDARQMLIVCIPVVCAFSVRIFLRRRLVNQNRSRSDTWAAHVVPGNSKLTPFPRLSGFWEVTGPVSPRNQMPRKMVIIELPTKDTATKKPHLLIHSAIACDEETMESILAVGVPHVMVVPSSFHRIDAAVWKVRFPDLIVVCPPGARKAVSSKVEVTGEMETVLAEFGIQSLTMGVAPGEKVHEYVICTPIIGAEGTVLICADTWFNITTPFAGLGYRMMRLIGSFGPFKITNIAKFFIKHWDVYLTDMMALKATGSVVAIAVAHGDTITGLASCRHAMDAIIGQCEAKLAGKKND